MQKFILKKDDDSYSLTELLTKNIKENTPIKYEGNKEWTVASELPELQELIAFNNSYNDIRPSNEAHVRKPSVWELMLLAIVLGLIQLLIPIDGDPYGGHTISVSELTPLKMDAYKLVALLIFLVYVYNIFTYRYYRLVKLKEENNNGGKTYYQIQTCISTKNCVDKLNVQKLKWWKSDGPFKLENKEEFKQYFDKITRKKVSNKTPLTEIKERNKRPTVLEWLRQENSYFRYLYKTEGSFLFMILPVGFMLVLGLMILLDGLEEIPTATQIYAFIFGPIVFFFCFNKFGLLGSHYYMRVVKNETTQGRVNDYRYQIEFYISRKNLEEIEKLEDDKWVYKEIRKQKAVNAKLNASYTITRESDLKKIFYKETNKVQSVTEEAID